MTRNCVKSIRKRRGITVTELARRAGTSRQTIVAIEHDDGYEPKVGLTHDLARALNTEAASLFWSEPERAAV